MIKTWSKFIYGHTVTENNRYICIDEGSGELTAAILVGDYSLSEYAQAVEDALNEVGALSYLVSVDRDGNRLTISASANFDILIQSGTQTASAYTMMGFTGALDLTGDDEYTGDGPSGSEYFPQFLLQSYVPPENWVESTDSTVNESADGRVEVIRFGTEQKMEMDIKFITDLVMDGAVIRNNPNGLSAALAFLNYIAQKKRFEFVPDVDDPDEFHKVILEMSPNNKNGTGFKLKELFKENLPDIYETGVITLRVVA